MIFSWLESTAEDVSSHSVDFFNYFYILNLFMFYVKHSSAQTIPTTGQEMRYHCQFDTDNYVIKFPISSQNSWPPIGNNYFVVLLYILYTYFWWNIFFVLILPLCLSPAGFSIIVWHLVCNDTLLVPFQHICWTRVFRNQKCIQTQNIFVMDIGSVTYFLCV